MYHPGFFFVFFFFFKQKTAYEMSLRDWSSDVCSSDLLRHVERRADHDLVALGGIGRRSRGQAASAHRQMVAFEGNARDVEQWTAPLLRARELRQAEGAMVGHRPDGGALAAEAHPRPAPVECRRALHVLAGLPP